MSNTETSRSLSKYTTDFFDKYLDSRIVNEICYNGGQSIFYEDIHAVWHEDATDLTYEKALAFGIAAAAYKGTKLQENQPIMSAMLTTGERIQVLIPPAVKKGTISITIRKPSKTHYTIKNFEDQGLFKEIVHETDNKKSPEDILLKKLYDGGKYREFISKAVEVGKNIIIAGETGSGKTTFMKSLIDFIPENDRLITIEDTEEISFRKHKNYVQLFYPDAAKEGDAVTAASLLKSCLRMKPNRILLAELRSGETYDYLNVISSGHGGSLTSLHAGSVSQTFKRLAMMCMQNPQAQKIPHEVIKKDFEQLIDIVVHMHAYEGKRVITDIYFKGA